MTSPDGGSPLADTATLRVLRPAPGVFAYYDGRVPGRRLHKAAPNWLDDGAYRLGIAAYAVTGGEAAVVLDSHISQSHARAMRRHLEGLGIRTFTLVLSHWHDDHIAGNAVFADGPIIAHRLTAAAMERRRAALETGDPPIRPLVLPGDVYDEALDLTVGARRLLLRHFEIHSADATVALLPDAGLLFAGDTVEDTITYISEAERTAVHVGELERLAGLPFARLLPAHGSAERIAAGGYDRGLIEANRRYLARLLAGEGRDGGTLADFVVGDVGAGRIGYFAAYEDVHRDNLAALAAAGL